MNKKEPIIVNIKTHRSALDLWNAITQLREMKEWYFDNIPAFDAEVGFETEFVVTNGDKTFTHQWEVTEVIPEMSITYTWKYAEYEGESQSIWDVTETADGSELTLTCTGLESFPNDVNEFTRESCLAGWNYFLKDRLIAYLAT